MSTPREKSPLLEALRKVEPLMLYHTGQQTQHTTDWAIQAPTPGLEESGPQMPECKPTLQFLKKSPKQGSLPWILIVQGKMSMKVHQMNKSQQHTKFNPHLLNTFYPQRWNVATSMVGLKKTNKRHRRKNLTQNGEPQRYNQECRRKRRRGTLYEITGAETDAFLHPCDLDLR